MSLYDTNALGKQFPGLVIRHFTTVDSTNSEARRQYNEGLREPALFLADQQEKGRGRHGRSFYSPADTGIYMTLLYPVHAVYEDARRATAKTAVAVYRGIRELTDLPVGIKWVNDLYLYGKKIVGILVESVFSEDAVQALIVGIGINVTTACFPDELQRKAGSLGKEVDRTALAAAVLRHLIPELQQLGDLSYLELYRSASIVLGKKILYENSRCEIKAAVAAEIDDDGALVVEKPDGTREVLHSGEVSIRTPDGW